MSSSPSWTPRNESAKCKSKSARAGSSSLEFQDDSDFTGFGLIWNAPFARWGREFGLGIRGGVLFKAGVIGGSVDIQCAPGKWDGDYFGSMGGKDLPRAFRAF